MNDFIGKIDLITRDIYANARYGDRNVIDSTAKYYKASIKSPTTARMVYRQIFKDCDKIFTGLVKNRQEKLKEFSLRTALSKRNAMVATNYEPAKSAYLAFEEAVLKMYPNSIWIRNFSVDTDRIVMDKIKGKAGFFHKLKVGAFMKKHGITSFFK